MSRTMIRGRLVPLALGLCALSAATHRVAAQTAEEQSAYVALIYTPVAGLPPLPPNADSLGKANGSSFSLQGRLGHMSRRGGLSLTTYAVGVEMPRGRTRFGATLGYLSASCGFEWEGDTDCNGDVMLGGSVRSWLTTRPLGASPPPVKGKRAAKPENQGLLLVGFDGSVGYSPRQGESAMAIAAGIPTALALQNGTLKITPFVTPSLAYGRLGNVAYFEDEAPTAHGGIAFMIGGGVGLEFGTSGVGANVGFQRVLKGNGGTTQLGLGFTWQGLTAAR